ncbi:DUF5049 domain-containing protein [Ferroacidibacillus organovorans]|uniref:DUF5049 domain-containing protein n=1 Tax=Ferroacidibacillus organovorans TaxID=1765683 RepID=A0A853KA21_9BACL|nr:DUF5049 domain-containing protein [Ferroacidibacillus organovorans]KYP80805.1 hypothetical protein AYJ22_09695 [Ferroacidibacillus organovorans]OAG93194.1 hypothetical protein AYW79_11860 [Ferroacidibacillus organovorans]
MDKILVPRPVFEGLEAIRQSGAVNMFDFGSVLRMAEMLTQKDAARWLLNHKREYLQGVLYGIEPEE